MSEGKRADEPNGPRGTDRTTEADDPAPEPDAANAEDSTGDEVDEPKPAGDEAVRRERDEYLELAQRTKADFENYRRRAARDAGEAERRGKSSLVRELVPVLDDLERALRAAGIDPCAETASDDGKGLAYGILLVYRELRSAVERAGVETYDPAGERFDPTWHEALSTRPDDDAEPGTVLETVEKGYRLDGHVLRAALVIVSADQPVPRRDD